MTIPPPIEDCIVRVSHPGHGGFSADSGTVERYMEAMVNSVNYKLFIVQAYVSEITGIPYFDCDAITLAIVLASFSPDIDELTEYMGKYDDDHAREVYELLKDY